MLFYHYSNITIEYLSLMLSHFAKQPIDILIILCFICMIEYLLYILLGFLRSIIVITRSEPV